MKQEPTTTQNDFSKRLKAVCFGTMVNSVAVTPFDVLKVRLQSQLNVSEPVPKLPLNYSFAKTRNFIRHSHGAIRSADHFEGILDGIATITRQEGILKLWRGITPTLLLVIPNTIIYFHAYEELRDVFKRYGLGNSSSFLAGSIARTFAVTCISPIELFRTRMQSYGKKGTFADVYSGIRSMIQKEGLLSLWRGLPPTLWRDVPFSGIYWFCYEGFKRKFHLILGEPSSNFNTFGSSFAAGALSGAIAAAITTPFDVAKTIKQVSYAKGVANKQSTHQLLINLYKNEGVAGLTKGIQARIAKCAPSCAILIGTYELGKKIF